MRAVADAVVAEAHVVGGGDYCYGVWWHDDGDDAVAGLVRVGLTADDVVTRRFHGKGHFVQGMIIETQIDADSNSSSSIEREAIIDSDRIYNDVMIT